MKKLTANLTKRQVYMQKHNKEYRIKNPDKVAKTNETSKIWSKNNRDRVNNNARLWRKNNPEKRFATKLKNKYSLTLEEYEQMKISQNNKCAICFTELIEGITLAIDHNHETNVVRGLLCKKCNFGIGLFLEDIVILDSAINYLTSFKK